jgi:PAS domain S-box-containing protein
MSETTNSAAVSVRTELELGDLPQEILDGLIEGFQVVDREYRYRYVNAAAAAQGRASPEQLLGKKMSDVYPGIDASRFYAVLQRCMVERVPEVMTNQFVFADGSHGDFELHMSPVAAGVAILSLDVSSRRAAERALSRSTRVLAALRRCTKRHLDAPSEASLLTETCQALVEVGGYRSALVEVRDADGRSERILSFAGAAPNGDGSVDGALRCAPDGASSDLRNVAFPVCTGDSAGAWLVVGTHGPDRITALECEMLEEVADELGQGFNMIRSRLLRERAEAARLQSERKFSRLFDCLPFPAALSNLPSGAIVEVNRAFEQATGMARGSVVGRRSVDVGLYPSEAARQAVFEKLESEGTVHDVEVVLSTPAGRRVFWLNVDVLSIETQRYAVETMYDVTERKLSRARLAHLNAVLRGIRNVSQLIAREHDPQVLIQKTCDYLVAARGFLVSTIVLTDQGVVASYATSGTEPELAQLELLLRSGRLPACVESALGHDNVCGRRSSSAACSACPVSRHYAEPRDAMAVRLESGGQVYGALLVVLPTGTETDSEEFELLKEVASDVASAIRTLELKRRQQRAEADLDAARDLLGAIVEASPAAVFSLTPDGRVTTWNRAAEQTFGWKAGDVIGAELPIVAPENRQGFEELRGRVCGGDSLSPLELSARRRDGTEILLSLSMAPLFDRLGSITAIAATAMDLTQRKEMEDRLRRSEERFRAAFEESTIGRAMMLPDGRLDLVNRRLCEMLGYDRESLASMTFEEITHPEDRETSREGVRLLLEGKLSSTSAEKRYIHRSGRIVWTDVRRTLLRDREGRPLHFVTDVTDITDRKRAEDLLRRSTDEYRRLAESIPDVIVRFDSTLRPIYANTAAETLLAFCKSWTDVDESDNPSGAAWRHAVLSVFASGTRQNGEIQQPTEEGQRHFLTTLVPEFSPNGRVESVLSIARDITERIQSEAALRSSEALFRATFEQAAVGIAQLAPDGTILRVNGKYCSIIGYDRGELVGRHYREFTHPDDIEGELSLVDRILTGTIDTFSREKRYVQKDSTTVWVNLTVSLVRKGAGDPDYFIAVIEDIGPRREMEWEVKRFSQRLERLAQVVQDLSQARSLEAIVDVVRRASRLLASADGATFVLRDADLCHYVDEDAVAPLWKGKRFPIQHCISGWAMLNRTPAVVEDIYSDERVPHDAYRSTFVKSLVLVPIRKQSPIGAIGTYWATRYRATAEDVRILQALADSTSVAIENVKVLRELEEGKARTRAIYDHLPNPTFVWRKQESDFVLADHNEAASTLTQGRVVELLGKSPKEMRSSLPGLVEDLQYCFERRCSVRREVDGSFPTHGHARRMVLTYGYIPNDMVIVHADDITEQRRTAEQLVLAQRLEAVGRLAGGVAHDFNNLLSVIISYAGFVAAELQDGALRGDVLEIQKAGQRAATLTRQLLAFSRKQVLDPVVLDINTVVKGIENLLRRLLGEDVEIAVHLDQDVGRVLADAGQLEQVVVNLAVNARDAMPHGGRLTITTRNATPAEMAKLAPAEVWGKPLVMLSVSDTGTGMDAATQEHIFEPFFTTKEKGKGTGLGLSTVYGIVKQSGGHVWVQSLPGQGTTFDVGLPRVDAPVGESKRRPSGVLATGKELILVAEDEEGVRKLTERILRNAGYRVVVAGSGAEAIRIWEAMGKQVELLLTDVVMPQMSGRELAQQLCAQKPGLKVLYMSGYTDDAIVHHGVLDVGARLIGKPFAAADLTRRIREILDGA